MTRLPKFSNLLHVILSPLFGARVQLKQAGSSRPGTYETFVDIMTQYKAQRINKPMVIQLVSELLRGENELIVGFNSFLAQADKIPGAGAGACAGVEAGAGAGAVAMRTTEWLERWCAVHRAPYWYNVRTQNSTWTQPPERITAAAAAASQVAHHAAPPPIHVTPEPEPASSAAPQPSAGAAETPKHLNPSDTRDL
jgi:histone deacetylase complex regulatory component SIN3